MNKRIWVSLAALLVVFCLCVTVVGLISAGAILFSGNSQGDGTALPAQITPSGRSVTQTPLARQATATPDSPENANAFTPTPPAARAELDRETARQMDQIQQEVLRLRGLTLSQPVQRALMSQEALRNHVETNFFEDYTVEEAADDARVLAAFGLLEADFDLFNFYLDLYSEQIAGFYDSETKEMYVIQGHSFGGPERSTYAHEFTHVLQDQTYDLREGLNIREEYCREDSEYCAAVSALIEGDATLTEQYWLYTYGSDQDRSEIEAFYEEYTSPIFDSAPAYMQEDFAFPYREGVEFVLSLFERGRYEAINAAFANPPVSTEMILHPEKYPDDRPLPVELPDASLVLGRDLRELDRGVMGEWYTYLILAHGRSQSFRLAEALARQAADGWGGDAYSVYWDEAAGLPVTTLAAVWDTPSDAQQFASAFRSYAKFRWGDPSQTGAGGSLLAWENTPDGAVVFRSGETGTLWVVAPTLADAQLLAEASAPEAVLGAR